MKGIDEDPHYQERRTLINIEDPLTGIMLKMPEIGYRMLGTPGKIRFAGLPHGSANEVILQDLLGYQPEDIERFKQEGSI